jgi:hypothetical protein
MRTPLFSVSGIHGFERRARVTINHFLLALECLPNLFEVFCGDGVGRQIFFQLRAEIIVTVGAGLDFLFSCARSYLAEFSAKTRNQIGLASVTINVFWSELNLALIRPVSGYLLLPFNVVRLSRLKRFTLVAVQSTISNHFRHHFYLPPFQQHRVLND